MYQDYGPLLGWLLVIMISGSILNYFVKFIAKKYRSKIVKHQVGKSILNFFITLFVRNHRFFGFISLIILLAHFLIQFSVYGLNLTGALAATLLISQIIIGIYLHVKKKTIKDSGFIIHRTFAVLLIFAIALHILSPNIFVVSTIKDKKVENPLEETMELKTFTVEEVAKFNGKDGNKGYVIYKGIVYDVSDHPRWITGEHNNNLAGTDLTEFINKSPHGDSKFNDLEAVGKIK